MSGQPLDLDRLLKLRLVVGRFGEMDNARWWNTKGQLGRLGSAALSRGFPRTHHFAQARTVFAVAANRCIEVFNAPGCVTLWCLPEWIEEEFEARWEHWLDHVVDWQPFFHEIEPILGTDLVATLKAFGVISVGDIEAFSRLRRSAEGRAVALPDVFSGVDRDVTLLALGFARGELGSLAVPYMRTGEA
ncbi:MAG TPA: BrxE family protein [Gemmatimonadaceae bacterium]